MDIPAHLALVGAERALEDGRSGTRDLLAWAASLGVRAVRLDATRPDVRPRALDRSARRDLAATLRRADLAFGGLDLLIPPEHFTDATHSERALDAAVGALRLAADLGELAGDADARSVAVVLPGDLPASALTALEHAAADVGAVLADLAHPARDDETPTHVRPGIDPPSVIIGAESPAKLAARLGSRLAHARLADISGQGRCAVGASGGRLDITAYGAALSVAGVRSVTVDIRGVPDLADAARRGLDAWAQALTLPGM